MKKYKYDFVTVGSVTIDITQTVSDEFLKKENLKKTDSNYILSDQFNRLAAHPDIKMKAIGGPSVNIVTALSMAGTRAGLIGKTGQDAYGEQFRSDIKKFDLTYEGAVCDKSGTKALMSYVTPDKDRTFAVSGSGGENIERADINWDMIDQAHYTHVDLFLMFSPIGTKAVDDVAAHLKATGGKFALTLNCEPLMRRERQRIQKLAKQADILVGSLDEFKALFDVEKIDDVVRIAKTLKAQVALTQGSKDVYVIHNGQVDVVPVNKVEGVIDTCGAGDQFAAGFIKGVIDRLSPKQSAEQGCLWSAQIIRHYGALQKKSPPLIKKVA